MLDDFADTLLGFRRKPLPATWSIRRRRAPRGVSPTGLSHDGFAMGFAQAVKFCLQAFTCRAYAAG
jgi:hypothetical protein